MLSVCIPIYNFVPVDFIKEIHDQLITNNLNSEIVIINDASEQDISGELKKIESLKQIRIIQNPVNMGRAVTRNRLAHEAEGDFLLFSDGDSGVENENYIKNYLPYIKKGIVCCGGTCYQSEKPEKRYMLRWKYGKERESVPAEIRERNPWSSFTTHQFLIDKDIFLKIGFDENIKGYGHEDTMFGLALQENSIKIRHIDNPLLHLGLETGDVFLKKSKRAVKNLGKLYVNTNNKNWFPENIKLVKFYERQKKVRMLWFWETIFTIGSPLFIMQLKSANPSLKLFDWYKFSAFCKAVRKTKKMKNP